MRPSTVWLICGTFSDSPPPLNKKIVMTPEQLIFVAGLSAFPLHRCYKEFVAGGSGIVWAILILTPLLLVIVTILASLSGVSWTPWVYLACFTLSAGRFFFSEKNSVSSLTFERNLLLVGVVVLLLAGLFLFLATRRYVFIEDHALGRIVTFDRLTGRRQ